jgi:hypothetical protein
MSRAATEKVLICDDEPLLRELMRGEGRASSLCPTAPSRLCVSRALRPAPVEYDTVAANRNLTDKNKRRIAELIVLGLSQAEAAQAIGVHAPR